MSGWDQWNDMDVPSPQRCGMRDVGFAVVVIAGTVGLFAVTVSFPWQTVAVLGAGWLAGSVRQWYWRATDDVMTADGHACPMCGATDPIRDVDPSVLMCAECRGTWSSAHPSIAGSPDE